MPQILALLHTEENGLLPRAALETLTDSDAMAARSNAEDLVPLV